MNHFDLLPAELLDQIASADRGVYWPLATGYPRFSRSLTAGRRVDFAIGFGYKVRMSKNCIEWTLKGKIHRTDGYAQHRDGTKYWYIHGVCHRDDGPAIVNEWEIAAVFNNGKYSSIMQWPLVDWAKNGKRHRKNGPATVYADVGQYKSPLVQCFYYYYTNGGYNGHTAVCLDSVPDDWFH